MRKYHWNITLGQLQSGDPFMGLSNASDLLVVDATAMDPVPDTMPSDYQLQLGESLLGTVGDIQREWLTCRNDPELQAWIETRSGYTATYDSRTVLVTATVEDNGAVLFSFSANYRSAGRYLRPLL